jgi:hypothetical protein
MFLGRSGRQELQSHLQAASPPDRLKLESWPALPHDEARLLAFSFGFVVGLCSDMVFGHLSPYRRRLSYRRRRDAMWQRL